MQNKQCSPQLEHIYEKVLNATLLIICNLKTTSVLHISSFHITIKDVHFTLKIGVLGAPIDNTIQFC